MISHRKEAGNVRSLLLFAALISSVSLITACSDSEPAASMVQYFVTNRSSDKINRLTVFLETKGAGGTSLTDSVFITNLPENLAVRLTYDINNNTSASGTYRLVALGNKKKWSNTFGKFTGNTDNDPDHIYHLEIQEDSIVVTP